MERLNRNVGPFQAALQKTPEVLHRVRVNVPVHIFNRVVDDFVLKLFGQAIVGWQFITEDCRARFDVLFNALLEFSLAAISTGMARTFPPRSTIPKAMVLPALRPPSFCARRLRSLCMLRAFPPMKVSSTSTSPPSFPPKPSSCMASRMR